MSIFDRASLKNIATCGNIIGQSKVKRCSNNSPKQIVCSPSFGYLLPSALSPPQNNPLFQTFSLQTKAEVSEQHMVMVDIRNNNLTFIAAAAKKTFVNDLLAPFYCSVKIIKNQLKRKPIL